ncbi:MAG: phosphopeptide-binding protein [Bacteroidota bacterium]
MRNLFPLLLLSLLLVACGGETASTETDTDDTTVTDPPAEVQKITLTPMPDAVEFPDAALTSMYYTGGKFSFGVEAGESGYALGEQTSDAPQLMCANSGKGQHIHLILNDSPYAAKYEAEFEHEVPDGEHHLLAFLSRSYHLSIKQPQAAIMKVVTAADGAITDMKDIEGPMLFYSRPKGSYAGADAEQIMLDFYPVNVELGNDYQVKVEVGGESFLVDKWRPYFFKGLPAGDHTVTLTLVDGEGNTVDAPLNPVSREISVAP